MTWLELKHRAEELNISDNMKIECIDYDQGIIDVIDIDIDDERKTVLIIF